MYEVRVLHKTIPGKYSLSEIQQSLGWPTTIKTAPKVENIELHSRTLA